MATHETTTLVEATHLSVHEDAGLNAIEIEVADGSGAGFRFLIPPLDALGFCLRVVAAVTRLIEGDNYA